MSHHARNIVITALMMMAATSSVLAFRPTSHFATTMRSTSTRLQTCLSARRTLTKERPSCQELVETSTINHDNLCPNQGHQHSHGRGAVTSLSSLSVATATALTAWTAASEQATAAVSKAISEGTLDPAKFAPVCGASDAFYRFLQSSTVSLVGEESFIEYGPLIAGGLLRIRLELCVIESFFNEAVGPFIAQNGISWILPLHETVETFLAGVIFALASTFILVGSSKIISVIVTYGDFLIGVPSRLLGGFTFDRASGKPVTLDVGFGPFKTRLIGPPKEEEEGPRLFDISKATPLDLLILFVSGLVKFFGEAIGIVREVTEAIDIFIGRYLVLMASGYVLIKFLHFKVFPDFPF